MLLRKWVIMLKIMVGSLEIFCVKMIGLGFGLKLLVVSLLWPLWLCASRLDSFVAKCFIMMSECVMGMSGS